ncbi:MAG: hypothetical protein SZ59_C0001G0187 [candidate division TM6 bacterium GW2011_GWF2_28_16]|nr:MAG: hypothetical protein SZ59_C0001G0187 [candidate division TM6 bacterium GW2011_GWF2_28_16]
MNTLRKKIVITLLSSCFLMQTSGLYSVTLKRLNRFANRAESKKLKRKRFFVDQHKRAIRAGIAGFESDNLQIRQESLRLLKALAVNGIKTQEIIDIAKKKVKYTKDGFELFKFLIEHKLGVQDAIVIANDNFTEIFISFSDIFNIALFPYKFFLLAIAKTWGLNCDHANTSQDKPLKNRAQEEDKDVPCISLALFEVLINNGFAVNEAKLLINKYEKFNIDLFKKRSEVLKGFLIKKGYFVS